MYLLFALLGLSVSSTILAAEVLVRNGMPEEVKLELYHWTTPHGTKIEREHTWTVPPKGEMTLEINGEKIDAVKIAFKVSAGSRWKIGIPTKPDTSEVFTIELAKYFDKQLIATSVHFLLVMDTNDKKIGNHVETDEENLTKLLDEIRQGREDKVSYSVINGDDVEADNILDFYRNSVFEDTTALVFIFSGHGGIDQFNSAFFALTNGQRLYRESVRQEMELKGTPLQVLLTNNCSNIAGVPPPNRRIPANWQVFEQLFFQNRGLVDITAAEPETFGWIGREGGIFTNALLFALCEPISTHDVNSDGSVSWSEFFALLKERTNQNFLTAQGNAKGANRGREDIRNYKDQLAYSYHLTNTTRWKGLRALGESGLKSVGNSLTKLEAELGVISSEAQYARTTTEKKAVISRFQKHGQALSGVASTQSKAKRTLEVGRTVALAQGETDAARAIDRSFATSRKHQTELTRAVRNVSAAVDLWEALWDLRASVDRFERR